MPALTRRAALAGAASLLSVPALAQPVASWRTDAQQQLAAIEKRSGGRLGVAVVDSGTELLLRHRADERFAMCSTFKFLAAAFVLERVDRGEERLDRNVIFTKQDLVTFSPATEKHADGEGMTIGELCAAALTLSDNTAGNLLLASLGGPPALTAFARSLGDQTTRLDRTEPTLNEATPGDPRDTTTPAAMLETMRTVLLRGSLSRGSREQLIAWLIANKTGGTRLRAGLPQTWRVGDKTGSGGNGGANDIAIAWPPNRSPILAAVYFSESSIDDNKRNAVIADVARVISGG